MKKETDDVILFITYSYFVLTEKWLSIILFIIKNRFVTDM